MQAAWRDLALAEASETSSNEARMAMMLITVSNSISEKAFWAVRFTLCVGKHRVCRNERRVESAECRVKNVIANFEMAGVFGGRL